jgi:DNA polymerase
VQTEPRSAALKTLQAWLENERRLGVAHSVQGDGRSDAASAPESRSNEPAEFDRDEVPLAAESGFAPLTASLLETDDPTLPPVHRRELPAAQRAMELRTLDETHVRPCKRCELHAGRKQTVFGVGAAAPDIVFVGEGPGADEDEQGLPFVGRAGQLLTRMIAAMGLTRDQVYICNVVKCRPPGNRTPLEPEMEACSPYLWRQLAILRPKVIIALGRPAAQTIIATKAPIGQLRGRFFDFPPPPLAHLGLPRCRVMPTFHPAYLLRSPNEKGKAWSDLKQVMAVLGLPTPAR